MTEIFSQFSGIFWTGIGMLVFWLISKSYYGFKKIKNDEVEDKITEKIQEIEEKERENDLKMEKALSAQITANQEAVINYRNDFQKQCTAMNFKFDVLQSGVLRVAGRWFIEDCQELLEPNHIITQEEFEDIMDYHTTYNDLGGNHKGDEYFGLVVEKFHKQAGIK